MNHQPHTTRPPARRHARGGYTLIEMLVAVAIITVLIGLTVGAYSAIRQSAARSKTKATLGVLKSAADELKVATGVVVPHVNISSSNTARAVYTTIDWSQALTKNWPPPPPPPGTGVIDDSIERFVWYALKNETAAKMLEALGPQTLVDKDGDGFYEVLDAWDRKIEYVAYDDVNVPKPYFKSTGYSTATTEDELYSYDLE